MKVAIIGSRNINIENLADYLPDGVTEIISGGARGVDTCARNYALRNNIKLTEFLPEYDKYKKGAPLIRNKLIVEHADLVIAFWDGKSRGTIFTLNYASKMYVPTKLINLASATAQ